MLIERSGNLHIKTHMFSENLVQEKLSGDKDSRTRASEHNKISQNWKNYPYLFKDNEIQNPFIPQSVNFFLQEGILLHIT